MDTFVRTGPPRGVSKISKVALYKPTVRVIFFPQQRRMRGGRRSERPLSARSGRSPRTASRERTGDRLQFEGERSRIRA